MTKQGTLCQEDSQIIDFYEFASAHIAMLRDNGQYSTFKNYRAAIGKLKQYEPERKVLPVTEIDSVYIERYAVYLTTKLGNSRNTIVENMKILSHLYMMIREDSLSLQHLPDPWRKFHFSREQNERTYLEEVELRRLISLKIKSGSAAALARDLFLVECFSGLRISDIALLRWRNYDGTYFSIRMKKTKRRLTVPVTSQVRHIVECYRNFLSGPDDFIFCAIQPDAEWDEVRVSKAVSNLTVRVNNQLKKLARRAGIEKNISTHTGRHTFATMLITKGANIYDVKELMGHTDVKVTEIYARLVDSRKLETMQLLEQFI